LALRAPDAVGKAFTVVDSNVAQSELVAAYRAAAGESWRTVYLPVGLVAGAAWCAEHALRMARRRSPVTYHQIRRATDSAWYDCSRAEQLLGWRPRVELHEGLRRSFASLAATPVLSGGGAPA